MTGAPIRRCPECGEEFQPHIVQCSDCGAELESAWEGDQAARPSASPEPEVPDREGVMLASRLTPGMAERAAQALSEAGLHFSLVSDPRFGLRIGVEPQDKAAALAILEREDVVPKQPDPAEAAVAEEGGPCPACGDRIAPATTECPGCGLQLSGAYPCRHCGADLDPAEEACPACGREQD